MNEQYIKPYMLILPGASAQLRAMADGCLSTDSFDSIHSIAALPDMRNSRFILAVELDEAGFCLPAYELVKLLYDRGPDSLSGARAMLLVHSPNELNTKTAATGLVFLLNQLGCCFPGHPLVEATGSLNNFMTWQRTVDKPLAEICLDMTKSTCKRFLDFTPRRIGKPNLLVLHSSSNETSNTLALWGMVKKHLSGFHITELHVENGKVLDCKGCSFRTCIHYSSRNSCFYGGTMVEEIYPAVEKADGIIWLCPNYNDAVSANLMAVINRLTALYRRTPFYDKTFWGIIVSGNSGGDSVARQLIDSLCLNKGFALPSNASFFATANDAGAIYSVPGVEKSAEVFAKNIMLQMKA